MLNINLFISSIYLFPFILLKCMFYLNNLKDNRRISAVFLSSFTNSPALLSSFTNSPAPGINNTLANWSVSCAQWLGVNQDCLANRVAASCPTGLLVMYQILLSSFFQLSPSPLISSILLFLSLHLIIYPVLPRTALCQKHCLWLSSYTLLYIINNTLQ